MEEHLQRPRHSRVVAVRGCPPRTTAISTALYHDTIGAVHISWACMMCFRAGTNIQGQPTLAATLQFSSIPGNGNVAGMMLSCVRRAMMAREQNSEATLPSVLSTKTKTINTRNSLVVTDQTTNRAVRSLRMWRADESPCILRPVVDCGSKRCCDRISAYEKNMLINHNTSRVPAS